MWAIEVCVVCVCDIGALLVQQAKCALSMEKALSDVKDKLAHHQQEACIFLFCCNLMPLLLFTLISTCKFFLFRICFGYIYIKLPHISVVSCGIFHTSFMPDQITNRLFVAIVVAQTSTDKDISSSLKNSTVA